MRATYRTAFGSPATRHHIQHILCWETRARTHTILPTLGELIHEHVMT